MEEYNKHITNRLNKGTYTNDAIECLANTLSAGLMEGWSLDPSDSVRDKIKYESIYTSNKGKSYFVRVGDVYVGSVRSIEEAYLMKLQYLIDGVTHRKVFKHRGIYKSRTGRYLVRVGGTYVGTCESLEEAKLLRDTTATNWGIAIKQ